MNDLGGLIVGMTNKGWAVFAGRPYNKDEFIIEFTGKTYTRDEYLELMTPDDNHFIQIDTDLFQGPSSTPDNYINHSCNPNCGFRYKGRKPMLYSIREIVKSEEITFDYSTTMDEDFWEMECRCGEKDCRGTIKDFQRLPDHLQNKYRCLGIVPDFIIKSCFKQ